MQTGAVYDVAFTLKMNPHMIKSFLTMTVHDDY